jgi:hypothetical protein
MALSAKTMFITAFAALFLMICLAVLSSTHTTRQSKGKIEKMSPAKVQSSSHSCTMSCSGVGGIDPVSEPEYNVKQVIRQLLLLEDHLTQKRKRCRDCILKHFNLIIGLLEEAVWLAGDHIGKYPMLESSLTTSQNAFDEWLHTYRNESDVLKIASELRDLRKRMAAIYYFGEENVEDHDV